LFAELPVAALWADVLLVIVLFCAFTLGLDVLAVVFVLLFICFCDWLLLAWRFCLCLYVLIVF